MIVVQAIDCEYSKDARGGEMAHARNGFQRVQRWSGGAELETGLFVERWRVCAPTFVPTVHPFEPLSTTLSIALSVDLSVSAESLSVWFHWSHWVGAPKRFRSGTPQLRLASGTWGQLEFNGRSSWQGGGDGDDWRYLHGVRNIAYFHESRNVDPDFFLSAPRAAYHSELAVLR